MANKKTGYLVELETRSNKNGVEVVVVSETPYSRGRLATFFRKWLYAGPNSLSPSTANRNSLSPTRKPERKK